MTESAHPAVVARRRRLHRIRVRIATAAVGLFIAVFSVIYAQMPASASTKTTTKRIAQQPSPSVGVPADSSPTPMTTSQS